MGQGFSRVLSEFVATPPSKGGGMDGIEGPSQNPQTVHIDDVSIPTTDRNAQMTLRGNLASNSKLVEVAGVEGLAHSSQGLGQLDNTDLLPRITHRRHYSRGHIGANSGHDCGQLAQAP
jgi:hypothetical protein